MAAGPNPARKTHLYARLNMPGDNKVDRRGIAHVDARTKLGRLHKAFKKALLDHFDGQPNIIERGIIERCCFLQLKCHLLDRKMAEQGDLTEMDSHCYIAWS